MRTTEEILNKQVKYNKPDKSFSPYLAYLFSLGFYQSIEDITGYFN